MKQQWITLLGATGSIGCNTLEVLDLHRDRYRVFALSAHRNVNRLAEQCLRFSPRFAVVPGEREAECLRGLLGQSERAETTEILIGPEALCHVAAHPEVQTVMAAIVGAAGLPSTLAAARAGKRILLANKEALVMSGGLMMDAVHRCGATLLPVDSEHNAIFQSLPHHHREQGLARVGVNRIILTASGGPFLKTPLDQLLQVTPDEACRHPNWVMGRKISVDSATMMNKGLELIEACWLFNANPDQVDILIHPESIIHSLVAYVDGSLIAQLGCPDMRIPIAHALAFPERLVSGAPALDLARVAQLNFQSLDLERFPVIRLAYGAMRAGGTAPAVLNAANEVAVAAFLEHRLPFRDIPRLIESVLEQSAQSAVHTLEQVMAADEEARRLALHLMRRELS